MALPYISIKEKTGALNPHKISSRYKNGSKVVTASTFQKNSFQFEHTNPYQDLIVWRCWCSFDEDTTVKLHNPYPSTVIIFMLENTIAKTSGRKPNRVPREHHCNMVFESPLQYELTFQAKESYVAFGLNFPVHFLDTWKEQFPWMRKFIQKTSLQNSVALGKIPFKIPDEIKELIFEIINCTYTGTIRKLYLKVKTGELLLRTFHTMTERYIHHKAVVHPGDIEKIQTARNYLLQHTDKKITIMELADIAGLNQMKLKQLFRLQYSATIHGFHLTERLKSACSLLCNTDLEIGEIAKMTGFYSLAHFTMAFHKRIGIAPSMVRKGLRSGRQAR